MVEAIDETSIKTFVHRVFRKTHNIGTLTVKSVREEFLKHLGVERLDVEQKKLFKKVVHDVYALYAKKHQEQNGDQGSEDEETQTSPSDDNTISSSSPSPRKKKRKIESDNESDKETTTSDSHDDYDVANNNNKTSKKQQNSKQVKRKIEPVNNNDDESQLDSKHVSNKQMPLEVETGDGSSNKEQQKEKKLSAKNKNTKDIGKNTVYSGYSSNEEEEQTESNKPPVSGEDESCDSSSTELKDQVITKKKGKPKDEDSVHNEGDSQRKSYKKKSKQTSANAGKKKSAPPLEDSAKLHNLKRYARSCGMHLKYVDIFADCKSMTQKEKILDKVIRDRTGFEGRITLKMCQKYKKKKEEADEVAELDCKNIITADGGGRATRSTTQPAPRLVSTVSSSQSASVFGRLRGIVDSDGSDSGDEKTTEKQAMNASMDRENCCENRKKRRRLQSSSDDADDD